MGGWRAVAQKWAVKGRQCSSCSCYHEYNKLEVSLVSFPSIIRDVTMEVTRTHYYTHIVWQKEQILVITKCNCEYHIECLEADEVKLIYYVYHCFLNTCFVHSKAYR